MPDYTKASKTLEFDKIKEMLVSCAQTAGARELASSLMPSSDPVVVRRNLKATDEAKELMYKKGSPSFGSIKDILSSLERADKGAALSPRELLNIAEVLRCARGLIDYLNTDGKEEYGIFEIFSRLTSLRRTEDKIYRIIIAEDMIADDASPLLGEIRRKMRNISNKIRDILQQYTAGKYTKYLQENIITQRSGRYVVPVKSEYKADVPGISHDVSASGATIFIEPMAVVEANNELRELEANERNEIERILYELSADCSNDSDAIRLNYYNINEIAFIFARAELSYRMDAITPIISDKKIINLNKARHPLLDKTKVVPISLSLGKDFTTLVITGPNTGGKTVSLKTVGLLALMAQSGLHIPASDESTLPVFENILADIGDEQSIEQSLSTFSSHMTNIVSILEDVGEDDLVLLDELCTGTDPIEGAALAQAILSSIKEKGAMCISTTHYAELKEYALNEEGVCNASCEFDIETLKPTYRLVIGTPGRSNAFAISERLGLGKEIINEAEKLISSSGRKFEDTIDKLEKARMDMEKNREESARLGSEAKKLRDEGEKEISRMKAEAERELERAKAKAQQLINSAKASSEYVYSQIGELKKQAEKGQYNEQMEKALESVRKTLKRADNKANPVSEKVKEDYKPPRPYKKGDRVTIVNIGASGTLLSDPDKDGNVSVQAGIIKTKTNVKNLMLDEEDQNTFTDKEGKTVKSSYFKREVRNDFTTELNIIGQTGLDGCMAVDKFLDEANLLKLKTVRIVHGKGTGALRKAIQDYLKKDKRVRSFRQGSFGEGDSGVTVVELK